MPLFSTSTNSSPSSDENSCSSNTTEHCPSITAFDAPLLLPSTPSQSSLLSFSNNNDPNLFLHQDSLAQNHLKLFNSIYFSLCPHLGNGTVNLGMVYSLYYVCKKHHFIFINYINSGFFGSIFYVILDQDYYIQTNENKHLFTVPFALKISIYLPEVTVLQHSPQNSENSPPLHLNPYPPIFTEPLLSFLLTLKPLTTQPQEQSDTAEFKKFYSCPKLSALLSTRSHPCLTSCYFSSHDIVTLNIDSTIDSLLSPGPPSKIKEPPASHPSDSTIHISTSLITYCHGIDLGNFTELDLKRQYALYLNQLVLQKQEHATTAPKQLTQNEYLLQNYNNIQFLSTHTITLICVQLLFTVYYIHTKNNIVHRDIKPANILLMFHNKTPRVQPGVAIQQIYNNTQDIDYSELSNEDTDDGIFDYESGASQQRILENILAHFSRRQEHHDNQYFPLIQLLDFGLSHIPLTDNEFTAVTNDFSHLPPTLQEMLSTMQSSTKNTLEAGLSHYNAYNTHHAIKFNVDYYAAALTVIEMLFGYIPGSKMTHDDLITFEKSVNKNPNPDIKAFKSLKQRDIYKYTRSNGMKCILYEYQLYTNKLHQAMQGTNQTPFIRIVSQELCDILDILLSNNHQQQMALLCNDSITLNNPKMNEFFERYKNLVFSEWNAVIDLTIAKNDSVEMFISANSIINQYEFIIPPSYVTQPYDTPPDSNIIGPVATDNHGDVDFVYHQLFETLKQINFYQYLLDCILISPDNIIRRDIVKKLMNNTVYRSPLGEDMSPVFSYQTYHPLLSMNTVNAKAPPILPTSSTTPMSHSHLNGSTFFVTNLQQYVIYYLHNILLHYNTIIPVKARDYSHNVEQDPHQNHNDDILLSIKHCMLAQRHDV